MLQGEEPRGGQLAVTGRPGAVWILAKEFLFSDATGRRRLTLPHVPDETRFAGVAVSLRAPRLAIVIPEGSWELHARRALEALSRVWGGSGGVLLPLSGAGLHPAVSRLLRRYDPDYVTPIQTSARDYEMLNPGVLSLRDHRGRRVLAPGRRVKFLDEVMRAGEGLLGSLVPDDAVNRIIQGLSPFHDYEFDSRRVHSIHPSQTRSNELSTVETDNRARLGIVTGDPLIDLAIGAQRGIPDRAEAVLSVEDGSLSRFGAAQLLSGREELDVPRPFDATELSLVRINNGVWKRQLPLVVLGRTANDLALAILWDRTAGNGVWLPLTARHKSWHGYVGVNIDFLRRRMEGEFLVTSASLTEDRCRSLIRRMWDARWIRTPGEEKSEAWKYVKPEALEVSGRIDLRLVDKWDVRQTIPVRGGADGSHRMEATFPLVAPDHLPTGLSRWIVEVDWPGHPTHAHPAVRQPDLVTDEQSFRETFVRVSGSSLSFESGRWDFVMAGASQYGTLAQPKLRWPGLSAALKTAASSGGFSVQPSRAGKLGRIAADLWGGREQLARDLVSPQRALIDAFTTSRTANGPIDSGQDVSDENNRLFVAGNCLAPFNGLTRICAGALTEDEIRLWLDSKVEMGAIRMGLILGCGVCPWTDFYRADEVGSHFECKRCGSGNAVTQPRWRSPKGAPRWYFSLHPTVAEFLKDNGDVPLMAVHRLGQEPMVRVWDPQFEVELVRSGASKPDVEIDFAFLSRGGLVLGEAKSVGRLDGKTDAERQRDVKKLLHAAEVLGAREVCFATTKSWGASALDAMRVAVTASKTLVTVSTIENVASGPRSGRKVLLNPAGP